jgi:hypothetical protein
MLHQETSKASFSECQALLKSKKIIVFVKFFQIGTDGYIIRPLAEAIYSSETIGKQFFNVRTQHKTKQNKTKTKWKPCS